MVPILVAAIEEAAPPAFIVSGLPACTAAQLSLSFDGEGGEFDGMSHSGTLLVLRNIGATACRGPALPRLTFKDADGTDLPIAFRPPTGMRPGPAVPQTGIAPGADVTATLRWVSSDVYSSGRCFSPRTMSVALGDATIRGAFAGTLCGPAAEPATYDQSWLKADARLTP